MSASPHVIPVKDEAEHVASPWCWCNPDARLILHDTGQPAGVMFVHRALDCRCVAEELTGSSPNGRGWQTVVPGQAAGPGGDWRAIG